MSGRDADRAVRNPSIRGDSDRRPESRVRVMHDIRVHDVVPQLAARDQLEAVRDPEAAKQRLSLLVLFPSGRIEGEAGERQREDVARASRWQAEDLLEAGGHRRLSIRYVRGILRNQLRVEDRSDPLDEATRAALSEIGEDDDRQIVLEKPGEIRREPLLPLSPMPSHRLT